MPRNIYETNQYLNEYLTFHYAAPKIVLPFRFGPERSLNFHKRCVDFFVTHVPRASRTRALDLGCAVGRTSFELSKHYKEVVGLDYSAGFIRVARTLKSGTNAVFYLREEGELVRRVRVRLPRSFRRERVSFHRADACRLSPRWGRFDAVIMMNLLDRLEDPRRCLGQLDALTEPRGFVLMTSPYSWMENFTPKNKWIGGRKTGPQAVSAFQSLNEIMSPKFDLRERKDMPFLYREHKRKYQWVVSEASVWRKKS